MITIPLEEHLAARLDSLAQLKNVSRNTILHQAIVRFLEGYEDGQLAVQAKQQMKSTKPLSQLRQEMTL